MSDLISRQALIDRFKQLKGSDTLENMFVTDVIKEIQKQPTAYDVDKVVEQLEEHSKRCSDISEQSYENEQYDDMNIFYGKSEGYYLSSKIVRKGGAE